MNRDHRLDQARSQLGLIPGLYADLPAPTDPVTGSGGAGAPGRVTGSPALVRLDVMALTDPRQKPGWHGEDPRLQQVVGRYGVVPTLETWTRVVAEEMPDPAEMAEVATVDTECAYLLSAWAWIVQQQWADELAEDVARIASLLRQCAGIRREYRPRCRYCRSTVLPVTSAGEVVDWDTCAYGRCTGCGADYPPGPALVALGQVQTPMPLKEISQIVGIPERTLRHWAAVGAIIPAPDSRGKRRGRLFDLAEVRVAARTLNRVA